MSQVKINDPNHPNTRLPNAHDKIRKPQMQKKKYTNWEKKEHKQKNWSNLQIQGRLNKEWGKQTIFIVDTGSVEDTGIDRTIFDVNFNGKSNEAHGSEEKGFAEGGRGSFIFWKVTVSATHMPVLWKRERDGDQNGKRVAELKKEERRSNGEEEEEMEEERLFVVVVVVVVFGCCVTCLCLCVLRKCLTVLHSPLLLFFTT